MEEFGSSPITNPNPMEASHDCAGQHCFCSCSCSSSNPVRSFTGRKRPFYPEEEGVGEEEGQGQTEISVYGCEGEKMIVLHGEVSDNKDS